MAVATMREKIKNSLFFSEQGGADFIADLLLPLLPAKDVAADITGFTVAVPNGTAIADAIARVPGSISFEVDGVPATASVTWAATTTPAYSATTAGDYVVNGTMSNITAPVTNSTNKVVKSTITVLPA